MFVPVVDVTTLYLTVDTPVSLARKDQPERPKFALSITILYLSRQPLSVFLSAYIRVIIHSLVVFLRLLVRFLSARTALRNSTVGSKAFSAQLPSILVPPDSKWSLSLTTTQSHEREQSSSRPSTTHRATTGDLLRLRYYHRSLPLSTTRSTNFLLCLLSSMTISTVVYSPVCFMLTQLFLI